MVAVFEPRNVVRHAGSATAIAAGRSTFFRRELAMVPVTAAGIIMRRDVPRATRSEAPTTCRHEGGDHHDSSPDSEEASQRSRDESEDRERHRLQDIHVEFGAVRHYKEQADNRGDHENAEEDLECAGRNAHEQPRPDL